MPRKLAAGNWKMHGIHADLAQIRAVVEAHPGNAAADILICPPATLIRAAADLAAGSAVTIGAQDCHTAARGAHTGDIAASMLADAGARAVIVGHSERRADHAETDATVRAKAQAAQAAGLTAIVCLGETLTQREAGRTLEIVARQLAASVPDGATWADTVIAYEPVWAIGTGRTPTTGQIAEVHGRLRAGLTERLGAAQAGAIPLLYGGSVKPGNAKDIFATADVDGALVGGASLTAADFTSIVAALAATS